MPDAGLEVRKIISGGQTGVDRGALDAAIELGLDHGGWCPSGRRCEEGRIPDKYNLNETDSPEYGPRTEKNVADSDATLVLCRGTPTGGTKLTCQLASQHGKPLMVVDLEQTQKPGAAGVPPVPNSTSQQKHWQDASATRCWLTENKVAVLNVAGPRESQSPGIRAETTAWLVSLFSGG